MQSSLLPRSGDTGTRPSTENRNLPQLRHKHVGTVGRGGVLVRRRGKENRTLLPRRNSGAQTQKGGNSLGITWAVPNGRDKGLKTEEKVGKR